MCEHLLYTYNTSSKCFILVDVDLWTLPRWQGCQPITGYHGHTHLYTYSNIGESHCLSTHWRVFWWREEIQTDTGEPSQTITQMQDEISGKIMSAWKIIRSMTKIGSRITRKW